MPRSFRYDNVVFVCNEDLTGDVKIREFENDKVVKEIEIPSRFLLDFVADYVRSRKISDLEEASSADILGIP